LPLSVDTNYGLSLHGVTDFAGNLVDGPYGDSGPVVSFSTASGAPTELAVLLAVDPPDGSQDVPASPNIQVLFSQPVDLTLGGKSMQLFSGDAVVSGSVTSSGGLIAFTPAHALPGGQYRMQTSQIADVAGNILAPVSSTFAVSGVGESTGLSLLSSTPAMGAVGIPVASSVSLTFSNPVSAISATRLGVAWQGGAIPGSIVTQGSTVTFTPSAAMPGAATVSVSGRIADLWGLETYLSIQFTTGANTDTTPPALVFTYPKNGAVVPASGTNIVLRFSKPVTAASGKTPVQILAGSSVISGFELSLGEDSQTFSGIVNLPPDAKITLAVTAGLQDFAGIPVPPQSIQFQTESDAESRGPTVTSVSPANGAVNVDVNAPISLYFSQTMEATSVGSGLHVTCAGRSIAGTIDHDAAVEVFTFRPDAPYQPSTTVEDFADQSIYGAGGERIGAFYSNFTTLGQPTATGQAVLFSAAANSIDVRFAGPVSALVRQAYLRRGTGAVPIEVTVTAFDQIRVVPGVPLDEGVIYGLVLDGSQEIVFEIDSVENQAADDVAIARSPGAIRLRFSHAVNLLTVLRGGIHLQGTDKTPVVFTVRSSLDRKEIILVPASSIGPLTVILDGVEYRNGKQLPAMVGRP
jgi:hypothetical protein